MHNYFIGKHFEVNFGNLVILAFGTSCLNVFGASCHCVSVKNALAEQQKIKKIKPKVPPKKKNKKNRKSKDDTSDDDDSGDDTCLVCCFGTWSEAKPNEEWVQCTKCKLWAHRKCVGKNYLFYCCPNCDSDDDSDVGSDL